MEDNELFSKEWQETEVTINRREFADIVTREVAHVMYAANILGDEKLSELIQELLLEFSAGIGSEMFPENEPIENC